MTDQRLAELRKASALLEPEINELFEYIDELESKIRDIAISTVRTAIGPEKWTPKTARRQRGGTFGS